MEITSTDMIEVDFYDLTRGNGVARFDLIDLSNDPDTHDIENMEDDGDPENDGDNNAEENGYLEVYKEIDGVMYKARVQKVIDLTGEEPEEDYDIMFVSESSIVNMMEEGEDELESLALDDGDDEDDLESQADSDYMHYVSEEEDEHEDDESESDSQIDLKHQREKVEKLWDRKE